MMGCLMAATGLLVLVLRAWVMHDGGPPDGGQRRDSMLSRMSDEGAGGNTKGDEICMVLAKDDGRADTLTARQPTTPKGATHV